MESYDVVVVGAGFAGLMCAQATAARGLKTLVLERKPDPGAQPHTTGLLVKEAADALDVPRSLTRKVRGIRLYAPCLASIDLVSPGYSFLATDTPGLLRWLAERAQDAGAELQCGAPLREARRSGGTLSVNGVRARYLVGADGARSAVARAFRLGQNMRFLVGVEAALERVRGVDRDRLHCFLDSRLAPGYLAWAVPGVQVTQVGLACREPGRPDLAALLRRLTRVFDLRDSRVVTHRGGLIPVGGPLRRRSTRQVLLVGDAAGFVSPMTAGGIHPALLYGRRAGLAVAAHLQDGGADPARRWKAPRYHVKGLLRRVIDLGPPNRLYDVLLTRPLFRALATTIFFHHRGLASRAAFRDVAAAFKRSRMHHRSTETQRTN